MKEQLPSFDQRVLDSLRAGSPPPPEARARVRARLEAAIPAMRGRGSRSGGAGPGGLSSAARALAVGAFVAGGLTGAAAQALWATPPAPRVVYVDRVAPSLSTETAVRAPAEQAEPPARAVATAARAALLAAPTARPRGRPDPEARPSQLSAERILLDDARAALVQGEPERSLDRLERHRREFPGGVLSEERDAMQIEALARAGRFEQARARADEFLRRAPSSLFRSTVDAAMAAAPPSPPIPAEVHGPLR
ncbi:MAG TPA: hypothetical protein VE987_02560 [Polyangiaceae bacterium]|nr:hypothetical protein [Polyangiaceae bacterium]